MKVSEPKGYDVELTTEEIKVMVKCKVFLKDIKKILEEKYCDTLESSGDDFGEKVDLETLDSMITNLGVLIGANKMY